MNKKKYGLEGYSEKNSIQLIRGGSPYFTLLEKLINEAAASIHFQVYIFEGDETGMRIANALIQAAQRGVKVFMLLDGYASRSLDSALIANFKKAGIHFKWFEPLFKGNNFFVGRRMHHKIFVADEFHSLVGGMNISNRYNDMPDQPAWLDCAAYVTGEASVELYKRCAQMYMRRVRKIMIPSVKMPVEAGKDCFIRVRVNDWVRNKNQISRSYLEMFRRAESQITIVSSYFLPGRVFRKHLRLATARGIRVRIVLTKISDVTVAKLAERYFYPWLLKRNIEIYEYRKKVVHAKIASYDGHWVTLGSFNFNDLSAYASVELNLDVQNPGFSQQVDHAMDEIITRDCDRITEEYVTRKTNILDRMLYRIAYATIRLFLFVFTISFRHEKN